MARPRVQINDTEKAFNTEVSVTGVHSLEEMESILGSAAEQLGLYFSKITTLGVVRYPGNRHWHLKQNPKEKGCLDVTYWPSGPLMWITMRKYEPPWVHRVGRELAVMLRADLRT